MRYKRKKLNEINKYKIWYSSNPNLKNSKLFQTYLSGGPLNTHFEWDVTIFFK